MKPFRRAILKLTAIYAGILLLLSIGFSAIIYSGAARGFDDRPLRLPPPNMTSEEIRPEIETLVRERDAQIKQQLLTQLIIINLCVLVGGSIASYFFAKLTLRPIESNMRAQAEFVSNASHELRTPLNNLRLENEILLRDPSATINDYKNLTKSNLEEVLTMSTLCDSLLSLSRKEPLTLENVNLKDISIAATAKLANLATAKQIKIINRAEAITIQASHDAFQQILTILLDNAIKYSPKKSKIYIETDGRKISVRDEGLGIPEQDLPRIFERFYRAEKSHTTAGHGLGLALAQHLAEQQNLKLTAQNNLKKGATFTIS